MAAQVTVRRVGRFDGRYRVAAGGAVVALALAGGIALRAQPLLERPDAAEVVAAPAGATSGGLPRVADRRDEAPGAPARFAHAADPGYAPSATRSTRPVVADRWFDEPATVTAPGFPRVADRRPIQ